MKLLSILEIFLFLKPHYVSCIIIAGNRGKEIGPIKLTLAKTLKFNSLHEYVEQSQKRLNKESLNDEGWSLFDGNAQQLFTKIQQKGIPLKAYVKGKILYGIKTGLNEAFVIDQFTKAKLVAEDPRSVEILRPFLSGKDLKRYRALSTNKYFILFPKGFTKERGRNPKDAWKWVQENYSAIAKYIEPFECKAKKRYDKGDYWWELRACDYYSEFEKSKIILPDIALRMQATYDNGNHYSVNTTYIIPSDDKYLLGILNSSLVNYYFSNICSSIRGGYLRFIRQYLETIPIAESSENGEKMVQFVDMMLQLNRDLENTKLSSQKDQISARINHYDNKINELVYQIYGLTEEEIGIVEAIIKS
ncbi:MAG: hypothetical protein IPN67_13005 [Bacteroidales bacterium]|nr:hypothetical protein [Bacteroidales bacterium]